MITEKKHPGFLLVISGPSGAGKGTVLDGLIKRFSDISIVTSWTTRPPRNEENDGEQYRFVSKEAFQEKVQAKGFLEWAIVFDHFYGTPIEDVNSLINSGKIVALEIDVQGARSIRTNPAVKEVSLFIVPPNAETLKKRLIERKTETGDVLDLRIKEASAEVEEARFFDYIIINDDLETAVDDTRAAILGEYSRSRWVYEELIKGF